MSRHAPSLTPRLKPLSPRKSTVLSVLDVGTSKVVCLVARLDPVVESDLLRGRTHRARIIGIGHQRARGLKGGAIVDLEAAEQSIRLAVDAAERMAKVEIQAAILNMTGGRLGSESYHAEVALRGNGVTDGDIHRVLEAASTTGARPGRTVLHSLPTGFGLDAMKGIHDPHGMVGERLGVDMHIVSTDQNAVRNLMLAVERCHLDVEAVVATPYAAGLAALVEDEAEMGAVVVDLGGGTTGLGVFAGGTIVHTDAFAVGGNHVTMDIARGLQTSVAHAERLKTLYGSTIATASDDRETIAVASVDDEERDAVNHVPKSHLVRIMKPRIEEILELVRDRLKAAGFSAEAGRRVVLTGGGAQLTGLPELARTILSKQVRIGRPLGVQGLPEAAKGPAFAAPVGLLVYPQVAGLEHFVPRPSGAFLGTGTDGYLSRMGRWIKDSF
ncbi:cell division protein FtsA [uncultured Alsobacter sp.]|uniref:cell division protein FtsA n=1 Tax=uncultured Alsobacter sp. TaxID=1748258 RepID=UPI0025CC04B3|nr:cell division protein FtsA [uncultured Alsobacter sp.]